ncbi:MAG: hypothetical protein F6J87_05380 [Spirulina sp. SIO3F2]|nr:hypothetical protein [Spirulina sp. SIO3F2]
MSSLLTRLEQYTLRCPQEVLRVTAWEDNIENIVLIFRGFSSSLTCPTATDPDVPILTVAARIDSIDRLIAPYNPEQPQYLAQGLAIAEMEMYLAALDI